MKLRLSIGLVIVVCLFLVIGCAPQEDYSEAVKDFSEVSEVEESSSVPPVVQQPKKVMPPQFESGVPSQIVPLLTDGVEKKMNKTVVPLSIVPKVSTNHVPVEVECVGPADNNIYVRETVIRTYEDGTTKSFVDECKGTDYLYVTQCSKVLKARSVSCKYVAGAGARCVDGACVKKI